MADNTATDPGVTGQPGPDALVGNMDDLMEALADPVFGDDGNAPDDTAPAKAPQKKERAEVDEPAKKDDAADDEDETPADAKKKDGEDDESEGKADEDDVAQLAAIRKRSRERKREREAARNPRPAEAAAAEAAPAAAPAKDDKAAARATQDDADARSTVATAVKDVLASIQALTEDEEDAAAAPGTASAESKAARMAAREAALADIQAKLGKLAEAATGNEAVVAKVSDLEQKLKDVADNAYVEERIEEVLVSKGEDLPLLSRERNAVKIVRLAAVAFFKAQGKAAPLAYVAEKCERVLARRSEKQDRADGPEKNGTAGDPVRREKQAPTRKTLSQNHSTPPSARTGPDKRSPTEVEGDFFRAFGLDPDER